MSLGSDPSDGRSARAPNQVPYPQSKWLVDIELDCCGHVLEDVRSPDKADTSTTEDGQGPHWGECPDCGETTVAFRNKNIRRLHEWCDECENWHACNEPCECERGPVEVSDECQ